MGWKRPTLMLSGAALLPLVLGNFAFAAKGAAPAPAPGFAGGIPLMPMLVVFGFLVLAKAFLLLGGGNKVSSAATGIIMALGGIIALVNAFVLMLGNGADASSLGPVTNYIEIFAIGYGAFFLFLGIFQAMGLSPNVLSPIAMVLGWMSLALGYGFYSAGLTYLLLIFLVLFVAMFIASLVLVGKAPPKLLGWWLLLTSIMLLIPAFIWAGTWGAPSALANSIWTVSGVGQLGMILVIIGFLISVFLMFGWFGKEGVDVSKEGNLAKHTANQHKLGA